MKKRNLIALLLAVLMAFSLAACGGETDDGGNDGDAAGDSPSPSPAAQTLTLYTWEGMFPDEMLDRFESETGIRINYVVFDTDETMLTKLQAANGGDYDLVIADDYIIEQAIAEGLVQKLDKSKIENLENVNPIYQGQFYDPADEYTVPYGAGVQTIVYDPALTGFDITCYADLWDLRLEGSVGMIGNNRVITGMALKVLGISYNTEDLDEIRAAGAKLVELAPNVRRINDDNLQDDLIAGEISAAVMYTSQVTMAMLERPDLEVVFPPEGIGFGIMAGFIPSNAPNADAAHQFLNFILDAENAAEGFEWLGYYSTNSAADALISPDMIDFLTLPEGFNIDMEMIRIISNEAAAEHDLQWANFRTAAGQ